jgi:group I intron endonuclease
MIGIYRITSPTGKVYIGQAVDIERRKQTYIKLKCIGQPKLYNSLSKYGFDSHTFEVVEECPEGQLNLRERYWQDFYNVLEEGLNLKLTPVDGKTGYHSKETREKYSKERRRSWKERMGEEAALAAMKIRSEQNPMKNPETRAKSYITKFCKELSEQDKEVAFKNRVQFYKNRDKQW